MKKEIKINDLALLSWALTFKAVLTWKAARPKQAFASGSIRYFNGSEIKYMSSDGGTEYVQGREVPVVLITEATHFTPEQMAALKKSIEDMGHAPVTRLTYAEAIANGTARGGKTLSGNARLEEMKQKGGKIMVVDNNNEDGPVYCDNCGIQISEEEGDNMDDGVCLGCNHL